MLGRLKRTLINYFGTRLGIILHNLRHQIAVKTMPIFANSPNNLIIDFPRRINNPDRITIGDDVTLGPGTFLSAITQYPSRWMRDLDDERPAKAFEPHIVIGNRVTATADLQLAAVKEIVIEDDVMFASNVHINDSSHGYGNVNRPYKYQPLSNIASIHIKQGCWIGQNVVILSGVTIGEMAIIGANTVVTRDIPGRCIAIGSPARIVKRWSEKEQNWVDVISQVKNPKHCT